MAVTTASPTTSHNSEIEKYVENLDDTDYAHLNNNCGHLSESDEKINVKCDILEETKKDELLHVAKREFHNGRRVWIKQLPPNTIEEDIQKMLGVDIKQCEIDASTSTALVTLEHAEDCETIMENGPCQKLNDSEVTLSLTVNENLLCVAHLPFIYTEDDFMKLVQSYGPISRCFLMRSDTTGQSKGYGFVEFTTKDIANQARLLLDGKKLGTCTLQCDWLQPNHTTYSSLHSKCLFVDHLPADYRDIAEFRKIFNILVNPPYCQIAMKNGNPVGFGLVEFDLSSQAEETQNLVNGHRIGNHKIRVTYCIPGVAAMVVYTKLTTLMNFGGRPGLLPAPPVNLNMLNNLQMLTMQNNPQVLQVLQTQLHLLNKTHSGKAGKTGLLGNAPSNPFNVNNNNQAAIAALMASQMPMPPLTPPKQQPQPLLGNPQLLINLQNLLMQQMNNSQKPSLLGNPAATTNLITAQKILSDVQKLQAVNSSNQNQTGISNKSLKTPLLGGHSSEQMTLPGISKSGLLPHPNEISRPILSNQHGNMSHLSSSNLNFLSNETVNQARGFQAPVMPGDTNLQSLMNLFNPNMSGMRPSASNMQSNGTTFPGNNMGVNLSLLSSLSEQNLGQKPSLLNQPIASHLQHLQGLANPLISMLLSSQQQQGSNNNMQKPSLLGAPVQSLGANDDPISPTSSKFLGEGSQNFTNPKPFLLNSPHNFSSNQNTPFLNPPTGFGNMKMANFSNQKPSLLGEFPPNIPDKRAPVQTSPVSSQKMLLHGDNRPGHRRGLLGDGPPFYQEDFENEMSSGMHGMMGGYSDNMDDHHSMANRYSPVNFHNENSDDILAAGAISTFSSLGLSVEQAQMFCDYVKNISQNDLVSALGEVMSPVNLLELYQHYLQQWTNVCKTGNISNLLAAGLTANKYLEITNQGIFTPVGQKRAVSHILPSPEPSPEGSYVGQHSQGLGGHYADSYVKRRRKL